VPADMTRLMDIAKTYGLAIIEDAAQALGSAIGDRKAGSMGVASAFSFHATKNIIAGEAGALTVNDPDFVERAQVIRDKGTNRSQFLAGKVDLYTWQDIGSSQVVNEVTAAFLAAQLEAMAAIQAERMVLWHRYHNALRSAEAEGHFALPAPPDHVTHNGHIFFVVPHTKAARQSLEAYLAERRIRSATHYVPLHSSPGGRRFGRSSGPMNGTERGAEQLLRLPLFVELGIAQDRVIDAVLDWCREQRPRH
jgi:dTDP-4-amino-4,6-dideoxygalactose transaminase